MVQQPQLTYRMLLDVEIRRSIYRRISSSNVIHIIPRALVTV